MYSMQSHQEKASEKKYAVPTTFLTSGSSGKMLSTSLLYRGLSAPQQPQTPERETDRDRQTDMTN